MATFLQGATDFFPPDKLFTPNWGLIQQGLMLKQSRYDKGFAQLSSTARTVIDSPLLNEYSKERRKQILADAEQALKDLPNVDLSLPQNVAAASSLFRPFYEDNLILHDMVQTKQYMGQRQYGMDLSKSEKEDQRNRYWSMGIEDLDNWADDFSKASPTEMMNMRSRRYVSKPNVDDQILKMFAEGKLKRAYDELDGQYKYTYENGEPLKVPLVNLYLSMAENDPEAMEGFNVMGRVTRSRFIRDNTQNGRFASAEEAAKAHDNALANDYFNTQKGVLEGTDDAMKQISMRLDGWKKRANEGTLIAGSKEEQQAIDDQKQYNALKLKSDKIRGDIFDVGGKSAPYLERILGNPTAFLSQTYLNKMAIDLATSLSQFGTTKVDTNPIYKDLVLPFKKADYEFEKSKQLEDYKVEAELRKQRGLYDLKIEYGIPLYDANDNAGTGAGKSTVNTPKSPLGPGGNINIPTVLDDEKSSAANTLPRDKNGQVNTYQLFNEVNNDIMNQLIGSKISFIEKVLDPSEIKDINGNLIPANKRGELINMKVSSGLLTSYTPTNSTNLQNFTLSSGRKYSIDRLFQDPAKQQTQATAYDFNKRGSYTNELDRLYNIAMTRYKSWAQTGSDNAKYQNALGDVTRINNLNDVWTGAIQFKKEKLQEVVSNLAGSYPEKATAFNAMFNGASIVSSPEEYISNLRTSITDADIQAFKQTYVDQANVLRSRMARDRDQPGDRAEFQRISNILSLSKNDFLDLYIAENPSKFSDMYDQNLNTIVETWNKAGNEFNYFAENQKGGGIASRRLVFYGQSNYKGEDADRFTESLIQTISTYGSEKGGGYSDDYVKFSFNSGAAVENKESAETLFEKIKMPLLNTVRIGGKDNINQHNFTSAQIAGNDGNWAAYTITVDPKWIQDNTSTTETKKLLTKDEALNIANGITVYVKKYDRDDKGNITKTIDNSLAAIETGRIGEIDMLLRANANQGYFTREISPGFKITVSNLSTGGYKVITDYVENTTLPNGVITQTPKSNSQVVDKSLDLTSAYYQILNSMVATIYRNEDIRQRVESSRMANPNLPKVSWNDVQNAAKQ